jgi:uncharacterized RDD family membrane protein YckC
MAVPQPLPSASLIKRFAAMFYDSMLLVGVLAGAAAIPAMLFGPSPELHQTGDVIYELDPALSGISFRLYLLAVMAAFFIGFWRKNGQTLGMQAWKIELQDVDGGKPSLNQCALRFVAAIPALLLMGAGYWWQWFDKDKLCWHDRVSKTRVVQLAKKR